MFNERDASYNGAVTFDLQEHPHKRLNALTGEWVLVSPHRARRPWKGKRETPAATDRPAYDPGCYLCPGNSRASGETNPTYVETFVFDNDFAALLPDAPRSGVEGAATDELFRASPESGICRVLCFSPRHDLSLARMGREAIRRVVMTWREQYCALSDRTRIGYVQIFENKGALMGCSNPHPHGQIWASESVPMIPALEDERQRRYAANHDRCLLCDYVERERAAGERIVFENDSFVALSPFWAVWPFETMLLPKRHLRSLAEMRGGEPADLANAVGRICVRYDNLFETEFPYSMGVHQAPSDGRVVDQCHLHLHYFPPLLRSASVKKFMVGYEMLAMPQRDITPESGARRLRETSEVHYLSARDRRRPERS